MKNIKTKNNLKEKRGERKNNNWLRRNILSLVVSLIFVSPVFFFEGESKIIYIIISALFGFFAGKEIINNFEGNYSKYDNKKGLLGGSAIGIYLIFYIILSFFIEIKTGKFFVEDKLSFFLILIFGTLLLYVGLLGLKTKKIFMRTFLYTDVGAVFFSIIQILGSIFILLIPVIFK